MKQFDTFLIGRKTFEAMVRMGKATKSTAGIQNIVFSRTMKPADYPHCRRVRRRARGVRTTCETGPRYRAVRRR